MGSPNRGGTIERVSRDKILRRKRGQRNTYYLCLTDHGQVWQSYSVDPYTLLYVIAIHGKHICL